MTKFKITYNTEEVKTISSDNNLYLELEKLFPEANTKFYDYVYQRILNSPHIPYSNSQFTIEHINPSKIKKKNGLFKKYPDNQHHDIGNKKVLNQWTVLNIKNNKYCIFENFAALCRALDIDYRWLYYRAAFVPSFKLEHFIISRNSILEKTYYEVKVSELL